MNQDLKYIVATSSCLTGPTAALLGADRVLVKEWIPGTHGSNLTECLRMAHEECQRRNSIGVTYRLESWVVGQPGVIHGTVMNPHWRSEFIYLDEGAAVAARNAYNKEGGREWRVVKQTREVLP